MERVMHYCGLSHAGLEILSLLPRGCGGRKVGAIPGTPKPELGRGSLADGRIPLGPSHPGTCLCVFPDPGRLARRTSRHPQLVGDVGTGRVAWSRHCPAAAFPGTGARPSTTCRL